MKAFVDKELCIGCGICSEECDFVFRMDGDGKAIAMSDEIPDDMMSDAMMAKSDCPVEAIAIG